MRELSEDERADYAQQAKEEREVREARYRRQPTPEDGPDWLSAARTICRPTLTVSGRPTRSASTPADVSARAVAAIAAPVRAAFDTEVQPAPLRMRIYE